jgi:hypothetical protein
MSTHCAAGVIPANPDIAGIGIRVAIYVQNFLSFILFTSQRRQSGHDETADSREAVDNHPRHGIRHLDLPDRSRSDVRFEWLSHIYCPQPKLDEQHEHVYILLALYSSQE